MPATENLVKDGTPICWADTTDYSNVNSGITRTHQLDLTSVGDGAARQGAKADLGATRAAAYAVKVCIEFDVAPVAGTVVEVYWSSSLSATAGAGNDGGASVTGADGAWSPGGGAEADIDEFKRQLIHLGDLIATADAAATYQVQVVNDLFCPPCRYGQPVLKNDAGQALEGDAVEMYVALIPIIDESQ
jgi:hypothetical protein